MADDSKFKITPRAGKRPSDGVRDIKKVRRELMNLLRESPGKRRASPEFSMGGARGKGAAAASTVTKQAMRTANPTRHLQRASVRMTFAGNKGNGQWKAHGRYIARESASLEAQQERGIDDPQLDQELDHEREPERERDDGGSRYAGIPVSSAGRLRALRQSYARALAEKPEAQSLNSVRSLSGIGVVGFSKSSEVLLPGNAPRDVEHRGSNSDPALRRGGDGERTKGNRRRAVKNPGFGSAGDAMPIAETLDRWQKAGDERMFKFILSPEFGDKLDLRQYTKDFVKKLEQDLGTPLEWVGVDHYNTEHPHVHLAVRGKDEHGKALRIDPAYVKKTMRERAQQVATNHLGFRTDKEVTESLTRQIDQQRYTELDRMILKSATRMAGDQGFEANYDGNIPRSLKLREYRIQQIKRLVHLEQMGLAQRTGNMKWQLPPNLEHALRQRQIGNDRLKTLFQHRAMLSDPRLQMQNTDLRKVGRVAGRLIGTGLDEARDQPFMLIEGTDGKVHYIYQSKEAEKARAEGLKTGEYVVLQASPYIGQDGKERVKVRFDSYGDADALLTDKKRLMGEVFRTVNTTKHLPTERAYGGWLGKYHRALAETGKELLDRGAIRPTPGGYEIAPRREPAHNHKRRGISR